MKENYTIFITAKMSAPLSQQQLVRTKGAERGTALRRKEAPTGTVYDNDGHIGS